MALELTGKLAFTAKCSIVDNNGVQYATAMHAYVACMIASNQSIRLCLQWEDPLEVHKLMGLARLRKDWQNTRELILRKVLRKKFLTRAMAQKLVDTGSEELVFVNHRCEHYLGKCQCRRCQGEGDNAVGRIMMEIRQYLVEQEGMRPTGTKIIRSGVFYSAAEIAGV